MITVELRNVSRWYGNVVAVNDITMTIGPGVTGLLGPNGAGKSTLLHLIAGFLEPSRGDLAIGDAASWRNPEIYRTVGLVPERDSVYAFLTGEEFVRATAKLHKLAAFATACLVIIEIPLLLLYLGTIAQAHGGSAVWHETKALIPGLLVGVMWAVLLAAIGLALASLSGRRAYATGAIAIYFFLTWILAGILISITEAKVVRTAAPPPGPGPHKVLAVIQAPTPGARLSGLVSPFTVLDGVRRWLGGTSPGLVPNLGHYGPAYGAMLLLLLAASLGGLAVRYRKAGAA